MSRLEDLLGRAALLSTGVLLLLVAVVGAVAVVAETQRTWRWYFRMEQVASAAVEPAVTLAALSLLGYAALVAVVDR